MRSTYTLCLAVVVAALAMSATAVSSAVAAPEWYSGTPTKSQWQQGGVGLGEAVATKWKGTVRVTDPELESVAVECESSGEGTAGPGAADSETSWSLSGCVLAKAGACKNLEKVKAVDLPWHTELNSFASRDAVTGEGAPGFQFTCVADGIKLTDKCTLTPLDPTVANGTGGVDLSFDEEVTCFFGSKNHKGSLEGSQLVEAAKGGKLEAGVKEGVFSKLTSSLAVKPTGKLKIEDRGGLGAIGVKCSIEATGTIEAGGKGTITSYSATGCEATGACNSMNTVLSINLPWKTELSEVEGVVEDKIVNGGSGVPQWKFECTGSIRQSDTCNLNMSPALRNFEEHVGALFNQSTNCSRDSHEGEGRWEGELAIAPPAGVEAIQAKK
jgi:hypothetical protein